MYMIELIQTIGTDYLEYISYKYEKVTYNCISSMYTLMLANVILMFSSMSYFQYFRAKFRGLV